ncbi:TPA: hypothetical protein LL011_000831 [Enterobacter hormaechei subsp. steigerwaltii]|nr:hypothetical protein [Enterobacter hormaechei]HBK4722072.1 hypothetical protein [Enterobacter hormaechei subsp. steigerwaltii]HBK4817228.1 hypothetical protein [Enterobacter hormaechei subsp. steigerwaltii]HCM9468804.1 hypothetical protein [Enterobacter hormaechei subsp. steigerwaltii]
MKDPEVRKAYLGGV